MKIEDFFEHPQDGYVVNNSTAINKIHQRHTEVLSVLVVVIQNYFENGEIVQIGYFFLIHIAFKFQTQKEEIVLL